MNSQGYPPATEPAVRRGWTCWVSLILTLLMLFTVLACGFVWLQSLHRPM